MMFKQALVLLALGSLLVHLNAEPVLIDQSFIGNDFKDGQGWTTVQAPAHITECSGTKMFGGFNKFGTRAVAMKTFELPPHHTVILKLQLWKIDSWDGEEFYAWVDDQLVWKRVFSVTDGNVQKCGQGGNWFEMILDLTIDVKHTGPTAVVLFTSNLNEAADNESWAFRDFQILVEKCPENCSACAQGETQDACAAWKPVLNSWGSMDRLKMGAEGWTVAGGAAEGTECGGVVLFGGYDKTGKGTILSRTVQLPGHYRIKVKLMMAKIDSWDNEQAQLHVDGKIIWQRNYQWHEGYFGRICGSPVPDWRDFFTRIEVEAAHTGSKVDLKFLTTLDEAPNNESFGVRDFYLFVAKCSDNCDECTGPKPADCQKCANNWVVQDGACKPLANFILLEQSFLEDTFTGLNGWTLKNNKGGKTISACDKSMVGGFDILGATASASKEFEIPPHKRLRLMMTIYKIDSWDNEWMFVKVDGVDVWKAQWNLQTGGANFCGQGVWWDGIAKVDEIFNHNAAKALIFLTSTLDQDPIDESWGFRDFKLFYEAKEACAVFYSECDFKGASFEFCSKSPNFPNDNIPPQIRSIKVPPQGRVTLYENTDYNGKKVVYTKDEPCIQSFDFAFLQSSEVEGAWEEIVMN